MNELLEYLPGILNAVKNNEYGALALAALVMAVVVILLLRGAPLAARFVAVALVFIACAALPIAVFVFSGISYGQNGSPCETSADCNSGSCYPGPHPKIEGSSQRYCLAADRNCALPGMDGAMYGTTVFLDGTALTCTNPGNGKNAQFVRR